MNNKEILEELKNIRKSIDVLIDKMSTDVLIDKMSTDVLIDKMSTDVLIDKMTKVEDKPNTSTNVEPKKKEQHHNYTTSTMTKLNGYESYDDSSKFPNMW